MAKEMKWLIILLGYHILFFWKQYTEPFKQATSEVISTFFPYWIYQGRHGNKDELIYYLYPRCIPFLSTFYPPHFIMARIGRFFTLDVAFKLFNALSVVHYLLGSILSFVLFSQWTIEPVALFGALTVTHAAFMIKIQPCVVYTVNWLPGCLLPGPIGGISVCMAILGGYWPYCVYFLPVSFIAQWIWFGFPWWFLIGVALALPQIIPFLWYLPRSVRGAKTTGNPGVHSNFGKVPIYRLLNIIWPDTYTTYINGVLSQEMALYISFVPLLFLWNSLSQFWWLLGLSLLGMLGVLPSMGRISARWSHLFTFSLVWLAVDGLTRAELPWTANWLVLMLQAFMLLKNNEQISYWPFTEWWKKPSEFWSPQMIQSEGTKFNPIFPYFTGYVTETITPGYTGGFALQSQHDKYGITDPNGERVKAFL